MSLIAALARRHRAPRVALLALGLGVLGLGLAPTACAEEPIDRSTVEIRPVYPAPPAGFLRLPDTSSAPVPVPAPPMSVPTVPVVPVPTISGPPPLSVSRGVTVPPVALPAPAPRPTWTPSRLDPVVGLDARGRITTILQYTPGRFGR